VQVWARLQHLERFIVACTTSLVEYLLWKRHLPAPKQGSTIDSPIVQALPTSQTILFCCYKLLYFRCEQWFNI